VKCNVGKGAHNAVLGYLVRELNRLGLQASVEPSIDGGVDRKRGDILVKELGPDGQDLILDFFSTNPMAKSYQGLTLKPVVEAVKAGTGNKGPLPWAEGPDPISIPEGRSAAAAATATETYSTATDSEYNLKRVSPCEEVQVAPAAVIPRADVNGSGDPKVPRPGGPRHEGSKWRSLSGACLVARTALKDAKYSEACAKKSRAFMAIGIEATGGFSRSWQELFKRVKDAMTFTKKVDFAKVKFRWISDLASLHRKAYVKQVYSSLCLDDLAYWTFMNGLEESFNTELSNRRGGRVVAWGKE
jgi:hypothetical protein